MVVGSLGHGELELHCSTLPGLSVHLSDCLLGLFLLVELDEGKATIDLGVFGFARHLNINNLAVLLEMLLEKFLIQVELNVSNDDSAGSRRTLCLGIGIGRLKGSSGIYGCCFRRVFFVR